MKLKTKIIYAALVFAGFLSSCSKDFLDRPSLSNINADNFYQTSGDLKLATAALYAGAPWGEWLYTSYLPVGEVLSGNMVLGYNGDAAQYNSFSVTGLNGGVIAAWKGMYKVAGQCDATINAINEKTPSSVAAADKSQALAEARFIRGYAYYVLALLWKEVPIIEDPRALINSPLVNRNPAKDVYQFVVNDLTYAAKNLPATNDKGRVTTWSAQGLLAKVYLTWSGLNPQSPGQRNQAMLDSAKLYAGNVCKNSGLELMSNYADNFKTAYNDNPESLFALQWIGATSDWFSGNMLQIYSPGGVEISANGQAGWFSIQPSYDIYLQYDEKDTLRRKASFMYKGDHYPELNQAGGGYTFKGDAGLKKHIVGTRKDNNSADMTLSSSPEHNALLRLSDVYLVYAEAILGNNASTADADALKYFNLVRERAGVDPVTSLNADVILKERRLELAAEGQYWYDLVALSYYNPAKAISILNSEKRYNFTFASDGTVTPGKPANTITQATVNTFTLPIPSTELTANPKLLEPSVPYTFK